MNDNDARTDAATVYRSSRRLLLLGGSAALLGGCLATTKLDAPPDQWATVPMSDAAVMPDPAALEPERLNRRTRVVVMQPTDAPASRGAGLAETAAAALETLLGKGGVEVVDRKMAGRLDQELRLIETRGASSSYNGPDVADFAITVVMGTASWGSSYNEASTYTDKKGKVTYIPPSYTYYGKSNMTLRIYELPSLRMVTSIPAEGAVSVGDQRYAAQQAQGVPLMRSATEGGIGGKRAEVLNELSPKGYISERRTRDKKTIFKALISKNTGAKKGDNVEIITLRRSVDSLTKRTTTDQTLVASGRVSDVIGDESSWIIVDDEKAAAQVRRGDIVRVKHSRSFFEGLF